MRKLKKIQHQHLYIRVLDINSWSKTEAAQMNRIDGDRSFFRIFHRNEKFIRNSVFRCGTVLHLKLYYVGFRN